MEWSSKTEMANFEARMTTLAGERVDLQEEKRDWEGLISKRQSCGRVIVLSHEQEAEVRAELRECEMGLRETEKRLQRHEGAMDELEGAARMAVAEREERWEAEIREMEGRIAERREWIAASHADETARRRRWGEYAAAGLEFTVRASVAFAIHGRHCFWTTLYRILNTLFQPP